MPYFMQSLINNFSNELKLTLWCAIIALVLGLILGEGERRFSIRQKLNEFGNTLTRRRVNRSNVAQEDILDRPHVDGEVRQEFTVVFLGKSADSNVEIDHESISYAWVPFSELMSTGMADSQRRRISDLLHFFSTGEKRIS